MPTQLDWGFYGHFLGNWLDPEAKNLGTVVAINHLKGWEKRTLLDHDKKDSQTVKPHKCRNEVEVVPRQPRNRNVINTGRRPAQSKRYCPGLRSGWALVKKKFSCVR
eukprot:EG_transcript_37700